MLQGLIYIAAASALTIAGLVLLILGAAILARGRVGIGSLSEVMGLRARLIGLGVTAAGAALWLVLWLKPWPL